VNGAGDFVHVATWALEAAVVVGVVCLVALRLLRRASLILQIVVVAVAAVAALVGGMTIAAQKMYVSAADFGVFLWLAAVAGVVSVALAIVLGRLVIRNSRILVERARAIGDPAASSADAARHVSNEFAVLARELAATDERLSRSREREARAEAARRELVAWISHDLRTPLAGLRAMGEALEDGVADDPARYHRLMLAQVDRLSGMVDDLFQLSTIHAGALHLTPQTVTMTEIVEDITAQLGPVAAARGVILTGRPTDAVTFEADPDELARAIANLVMNSIRLSPAGSEIVVSGALGDDDFVVLSVTDAAGGIRETDLGRVFEPGWQASEARTPSASVDGAGAGAGARAAAGTAGGAGLGLAIVQGIAVAHHGRVAVQNTDDGCRFDVFVPRTAPAVPAAAAFAA
jgi:signal transduction histidine kinase